MRITLAFVIAFVIMLSFGLCGSETNSMKNDSSHATSIVNITLTFNNEKVIVKMYDNPTTRDFLTLLPLTLEFEDYAGTEKISYLPKKLSIEGAPTGCDPSHRYYGNFRMHPLLWV